MFFLLLFVLLLALCCLFSTVTLRYVTLQKGAHLGLGVLQGGARADGARVGRQDRRVAPLQVPHSVGEQGQPDQALGSEDGEQSEHAVRPQEHGHEGA